MAKVKLAPAVESIHGHVGNMLFKRVASGEIVGKMPDRTGVVPSALQLAQREKFGSAIVYGKAVMIDPVNKQMYEDLSAARGVPAFAVAVGDFLNPPTADTIDLSSYTGKAAEKIRIRASDDVGVEAVSVTIRKQNGDVVETGDAVQGATGRWEYTTTQALEVGEAVAIEVVATDLPGNTGTKNQPRP
jgi:hypothetical protein